MPWQSTIGYCVCAYVAALDADRGPALAVSFFIPRSAVVATAAGEVDATHSNDAMIGTTTAARRNTPNVLSHVRASLISTFLDFELVRAGRGHAPSARAHRTALPERLSAPQ